MTDSIAFRGLAHRNRYATPQLPVVAEGAVSVPVVSAVNYPRVDIAGGGQRVVVTVDSSVECSAISAGGVAFTSFAIDDATHVSGVPGAHAAGVVDVVVTNSIGNSTTGTGLITYWSPLQITGVTRYFDSSKSVTDAGAGAVSSWVDQTVNADAATQAVGANRPILTSNAFGTMPSIRFSPQQWLTATGEMAISPFSYFAVVKYTSSDSTVAEPVYNPALTIIGGSGGWSNFGMSAGAIVYNSYDVAPETWGSNCNDGVAHLVGVTSDATPSRQGYKDGAAVGAASTLGGVASAYWDQLGVGFNNVDGFDGDIGAVISLDGAVISAPDLAALTEWSQQRFGSA